MNENMPLNGKLLKRLEISKGNGSDLHNKVGEI
jgi:hypothetical protein